MFLSEMMDLPSDYNKSQTTPERKKQYIQHWLEGDLLNYYCIENEKETPSNLDYQSEECKVTSAHLSSPSNLKFPSICVSNVSPVLGGKRLASSPVIGGNRRIIKRIKLIEKLDKTKETKEIKFPNLLLEAASTSKIHANYNTDNPKILLDCDNKLNKTFITESSEISIENDDNNEKTFPNNFENPFSQLIESITSGEKSQETIRQEILSVSEKTESDLIEDISSQLMIETSYYKKPVPLSQNISNPSSTSSDETNCSIKNEVNVIKDKENQQTLESSSIHLIDTVSTVESKENFSKISYILHYAEQKQKKRKNPKKGSLLELLLTAIAREKSDVNLLRHQLQKKSSIITEKSYVLLQIVQHLPMNNGNQFFKCLVIEDSMGLLNDFLKNKANSLITVMNIPQISCLVNICEKPILKVYEPFVILDPIQLVLQITRFMAVPPNNLDNLSIINKNMHNKDLKVVRKFHCPCLNEKEVSLKCDLKYTGTQNEGVKIMFDYY